MIERFAAAALLTGLTVVSAGATPSQETLAPADRAAVFKAAGFKQKAETYVRCEEDPPTASYQPGRIEAADLNSDGQPEAWVFESSLFCYGNTAESFVLVTKDAGGTWRKLADEVGVPTALETKRQGWPDIKVGGPGFSKFPVLRWNGKTYDPPR